MFREISRAAILADATTSACVALRRSVSLSLKHSRTGFCMDFQSASEALKPGDPMDKATTLGPLSTESAVIRGGLDAITGPKPLSGSDSSPKPFA